MSEEQPAPRTVRPAVRVDPSAVAVAQPPTAVNGRANEPPPETDSDYLSGLIAAAVDKQQRVSICEVFRPVEGAEPDADGKLPEKVLFRFGVRMLDDREDDAAREKHTSNKGVTGADGRDLTETDWVRYRCQVIFDATVDQPYSDEIDGVRVHVAGKELWRNPTAWQAVGDKIGKRILDPVEFVYRVLLPEEKGKFFVHIGNLSRVMRGREVRRALNA